MTDRVVVVGGGIGGLAAARRLAAEGAHVTVLEAGPHLGGLAEGFDIAGFPIERYYHYVLPQEAAVLQLIDELGLTPRLRWFPGSIGILTGAKVWPFTSPLDLLRFAPLSPAHRIRAGIGALRLGRVREWEHLDRIRARDWLSDLTSPAVTGVVWDPLLRAKFGPAAGDVPAAWMWGRLDQRRQARSRGGEVIGYLEGGFAQMFRALADDIRANGVEVRTAARAQSIRIEGGRVTGVDVAGSVLPADKVLFAGTLPQLPALLPPDLADPRWTAAKGLGALCVVFDTPRPVTDVFWTNVCDEEVPFGGIIEHTNLVPPAWYGGRHVVYLSRYFTEDEAVASADPQAEAKRWLAVLERTFPHFSADEVGELHAFRTPYAAPLVSTPYLPMVAPVESHVPGLYLSTTAQIYPQDRGMSEGIRRAGMAVDVMQQRAWTCPVCGSGDGQESYGITSTDSDGGVDPAAFRPSSEDYGRAAGVIMRCSRCGHGSLAEPPALEWIADAYAAATDEVSLREEAGQVETARRDLAVVERFLRPGRVLDVGCWTGSFLVGARERGWEGVGVEPSRWAADRAAARGIDVRCAEFEDADLSPSSFRLIVSCDVLEHLLDPGAALDRMHSLLEPDGGLFLTVPDAGSRLARTMGKRWWAIVPMHVQYFTRDTMRRLLDAHGFDVQFIGKHPKVFSLRYYAERAAGFLPVGGRAALRAVESSGQGERLVAPDFGDRMRIVATRR